MNGHDPMCDDHHDGGDCPWCNFAARVREDERDNCWGAVAEIVPSELWNGATTEWWIVKADALAAIEALSANADTDANVHERRQAAAELTRMAQEDGLLSPIGDTHGSAIVTGTVRMPVVGDTYDYDHASDCAAFGFRRGQPAPMCTCPGAYARGEEDGYAAALRDAVAAVKALGPVVDAEPDGHGGYRERRLEFAVSMEQAVAAIEALGGER